MSEHTPGPWKIRAYKDRGFAIDFNEDQEQIVDFVYEEADAHLIAAAPDLLEALEAVVRVADRATVEFDMARAAIAKARGEP